MKNKIINADRLCEGAETKFTYAVTEERCSVGDREHISYGIVCLADADIEGCACAVASLRDITSDKSALDRLVGLFNRLALSPKHFFDAVSDHMNDPQM